MLIDDLTSAGAIPALEASIRYAGQRHKLIAHNIANLSTPNYIPRDVPPERFREALSEAVERRRARTGGAHGELDIRPSAEIDIGPGGGILLRPKTPGPNVLFHDRNNRDLERTMQDLAENAAAFRVASDLLRSRYNLLENAIGERV